MRKIHVLLIEDNRADVLLITEALAEHAIPHQLHLAADGAEAIDFVARMGKPGEAPCPDILLLDLNLPKVDGADVLQEFRRHPQGVRTPVIVVSSSDAPRDRQNVGALGIAHYFKKPTDLEAFLRLGAIVKELVDGLP